MCLASSDMGNAESNDCVTFWFRVQFRLLSSVKVLEHQCLKMLFICWVCNAIYNLTVSVTTVVYSYTDWVLPIRNVKYAQFY